MRIILYFVAILTLLISTGCGFRVTAEKATPETVMIVRDDDPDHL